MASGVHRPPAWAGEYVGIPFAALGRGRDGCDCWGLVRLVLAERFGVAVPSYAGAYAPEDYDGLAALIAETRPGWHSVAPGAERPGDVVLLRLRGLPLHVGVVVARGWMLHVTPRTESVLERFGGLEWENRVLGLYRHQAPAVERARAEGGQGIAVRAVPHPFSAERVDLGVPAGLSLAEIVAAAVADPVLRAHAAVFVGDHAVPREAWARVRPKAGAVVTLRVVPQGDRRKVLRTILTIAVVAAAITVPGLQGLAGTAVASGTVGGALLSAGIGTAGSLLINALVPLRPPKLGELSGEGRVSGFLSGAANRADLFGVVPKMLGRVRMTPPLAARPFTELSGDDQFLRLLLCWGLGPLTLPDGLKIGETAIEEFEGVSLEHVQGFAPDPKSFAPGDVDAAGNRITIPGHGLLDDQAVQVTTDGTLPAGLAANPQAFGPNDVDFATDRIAIAGHGLADGQPVEFATDDRLPGGLAAETRFYAVNTTAGDFQVSTAPDGAPVDLGDGGAGAHNLVVGHVVANATANDLQLAAAAGGAPIDLTDGGAGVHTIARLAERLTLFTDDVFEDALALTLDETFQVQTSQPDADEIAFEVTLPQGLVQFSSEGKLRPRSVVVEAEYSLTGQNDWSAGALGNVFAARTFALGAPPTANTYRFPGGESYTTRVERIDRVVMNRFSGALEVIKGRAVETAVTSGFFPRFDPESPQAPLVPGGTLPIAAVRRRSGEGVVTDAVITDERDPDATDPEFGPTDFVPSESAPQGRSIDVGAGTLVFVGLKTTAAQASPLRRGLRFAVPQRGQYDVRLRRTTPEAAAGGSVLDQAVWTALRTFTKRPPVTQTGLAMTALRIKATDQLTGSVPPINGVVQSILPDWDGTQWLPRPTSNPAAAFRAVLQGAGNARPLADGRLDLASLEAWHERNSEQRFTFDQAVDFPATVLEILAEAASAGRAAPTLIDGRWGVVVDEPKGAPVQHFTPRNSWGFSGEKAFAELPHGFRTRFVNADEDWRQDERIVYRDGFSAANATRFEGLELPGVTDPELVWRHARFALAQAELRPESFTWFADLEAIVCTRGDPVLLTHDVLLVGLASGRIKAVATDGNGDATGVTVDEALPMELGKSYGLSIRKADGDNALTAAIVTDPGEQTTVGFVAPIPAAQIPAAGDLFGFGEAGLETLEVLVTAIEPGEELTFRLTAVPAAPDVHKADDLPLAFAPGDVDAANNLIAVAGHGLQDGDLVSVTTDGTLPGGLAPNPVAFAPADVDTGTDRIALAGHGLADGQVVVFTNTGGKLPDPLRPGRKLFVVGATAGDLQVAAAKGGAPIDLTDQGTGTHQLELSYVVANALPNVFQLRRQPAAANVDLTDGGAGGHTATRLIPPFDSRITAPAGLAAPAVESILSDGSVLGLAPDGSYVSRILVRLLQAATPPSAATIEGQFRPNGTDRPWIPAAPVPADAREVSFQPVEDGETCDLRLRYRAAAASVFGQKRPETPGAPGPWGPTLTHVVLGKSAPPADVSGFSAQQNGPVVTFSWTQVPDLDLQGYEIRFGPPGVAWADADPLTQVTRGTRVTTASVPPGTFDFHIRAKDSAKPATAEGGNFSANSAVVSLTVTSALDIVVQRRERPAWTGALTGFLRNPMTGDLNPESAALAAADTAQDVFDAYVWRPVATGSYEAPEIALDFADQVRAWADADSVLGPGESGLAAPVVELDYHAAGGYDGFEPWTIGELEARFFKFRIAFDFAVGLVRLKDFRPTVDVVETELRGTLAVPAGGASVVFAERFHTTPQVIADAEAAGGALRFVRRSNVSETGFDAVVVDAANQDTGGTMTYSARGT